VTESHTTYPVLLLFRSPEPWLNWIIGSWPCSTRERCRWRSVPRRRRARRASACVWASRCSIVCGFAGLPGRSRPRSRRDDHVVLRGVLQRRRQVESHRLPTSAAPKRRGRTFGLADQLREFGLPSCGLLHGALAPWSGTRRNLRAGVVEPKRPPHRAPAGVAKLMSARPEVVNPLARNRPAREAVASQAQ